MKTALHPASHIFPVDSNELCVSLDSIWPSLAFWGSWDNTNVHSLSDIILPPFVRPTVIGGLLDVVCSWGLLSLM